MGEIRTQKAFMFFKNICVVSRQRKRFLKQDTKYKRKGGINFTTLNIRT